MMTFKEYLIQLSPRYQPRVKVTIKDLELMFNAPDPYRYIVSLIYLGKRFDYVIKMDSPALWTMDEDGNPRQRSCFIFVNKE